MGPIVAIVCLALFSVFIYAASRRWNSRRLGPLSRRQVAARVAILGAVVALTWLLFPFLWVAFFGPSCCNP